MVSVRRASSPTVASAMLVLIWSSLAELEDQNKLVLTEGQSSKMHCICAMYIIMFVCDNFYSFFYSLYLTSQMPLYGCTDSRRRGR